MMNSTVAQPSLFSREIFTNGKGDTLLYRMLFPDYNLAEKYPLVVFLHGMGERGNDNDAQLKWGVMNFATDKMMQQHPAIVIAPQCPDDQYWSNFLEKSDSREMKLEPSPTKPMELVFGLINKIIHTFGIDTSRIYITGLSMGGYGTFDAICRHPELFAAAVPVCGGGDTSMASTISHIPVWMFHGAEDPAVPVEYSADMASALRHAGAFPGCTIYPSVGHFAWIQAYSDELMMEWLFHQRKTH